MFLNKIMSEISLILASAISKINFFLIFLKFSSLKNLFLIILHQIFHSQNLSYLKLLITVLGFNDVIFDISLITISNPNLKFCSNLRELFSK